MTDTSELPPSPGYLATGQTLCHDANGREIPCEGSGQDAESSPGAPWPEPRLTGHGDTVRDALTGLVWYRDALPAGFPLSWDEALDHVAGMNADVAGGHADWRLPNRREMRSLISHAERVPALPAGHPFHNLRTAWFWTATTYAADPRYAWYVHTEGGRMFYGRKDTPSMLLPVRGTSPVLPDTGQRTHHDADGRDDAGGHGVPWPEPRLIAEGDVVRDALTGLVWTRDADLTDGPVPWADAFETARRLERGQHAGLTRWRLPTINELESLVDAAAAAPALPEEHPFRNVGEAYWSSTNSAFEPDWAMCLYMHKGAVGVGYKTGEGFGTWCVCDP